MYCHASGMYCKGKDHYSELNSIQRELEDHKKRIDNLNNGLQLIYAELKELHAAVKSICK